MYKKYLAKSNKRSFCSQLSECLKADCDKYSPNFCDLHIHTLASDGECTPSQILTLAKQAKLKAIAICDHDTLDSFVELTNTYPTMPDGTVMASGVEILPGIEINSQCNGTELHFLGYFVNHDNKQFLRLLALIKESRLLRINHIIARLRALGIGVEASRVLDISKGESIGRRHVAEALLEGGYVKSIREAFESYLGIGKPGYAERYHPSPKEAIMAIRKAGGVAVWAHPGTARADSVITELVEAGLQGIEVYHPEHDSALDSRYKAMAEAYRLIPTGGSDFHSLSLLEGSMVGSHGVCYDSVKLIKQLAGG